MRLVLNYRNCKSIDQVRGVDDKVNCSFSYTVFQVLGTISAAMERRIIKLIDLDGETPIKELQGIKDGMNIVAVGGEGFKKAAYPLINAAASQFDLRTEVDDVRLESFSSNITISNANPYIFRLLIFSHFSPTATHIATGIHSLCADLD